MTYYYMKNPYTWLDKKVHVWGVDFIHGKKERKKERQTSAGLVMVTAPQAAMPPAIKPRTAEGCCCALTTVPVLSVFDEVFNTGADISVV